MDMILYVAIGLLTVGIPVGYWLRYRAQLQDAKNRQETARRTGMIEPPSLHPKIDPNRCICSGGCTAICPEGGIIGIVGGKADLVTPTKCIGHGACRELCPVDAITLVFGTERRGVDIPHLSDTFETNVKGIYIAGELGGMGLIRNAFVQGKEAVEYIYNGLDGKAQGVHDLLIVGAGPAGLSATLQAKKMNLDYVTLEQGEGIGGTVASYPRQKLVMTQPMEIPLYGKFKQREISKEELMELWEKVAAKTAIRINDNEKVESIGRQNGHYLVASSKGEYAARRVLLAIGRRGSPRTLGVAGENTPKVAYKLMEPEQYKDKHILVVGGGDSAVEAAVTLSEQPGTRVALSYRRDAFSRVKEKNLHNITRAGEEGQVEILLKSQVREIRPREVVVTHDGEEKVLRNDYVFVMIGGVLPTALLEAAGVKMEKKFGER